MDDLIDEDELPALEETLATLRRTVAHKVSAIIDNTRRREWLARMPRSLTASTR
jgi:hypothetical protein